MPLIRHARRGTVLAALTATALLGLVATTPAFASPSPPTVLLPNIRVAEPDSGAARVTVNISLDRPNPYNVPISVGAYDFTPVGVPGSNPPSTYGTATPGADYVPVPQFRVVWKPGQQIATFPVTVLGDTLDEDEENINIRFVSANGVMVTDNDTNIVVGDNDPFGTTSPLDPPTLFLPNAEILEADAGCAPYTVSLNLARPAPGPVSVQVHDFTTVAVPGSNPPRTYGTATPGVDYVGFPAFTLTFAAGSSTATFPVRICGDTVPEGDEEIDIRVAGAQGITVSDNDLDLILNNDD